jgi:hypothetical protein
METLVNQKEKLNHKIRSYRKKLNALIDDYYIVDESMLLEFDNKIDGIARKLANAKHKVSVLNN